jgi:hypothetical protein
VIVNKSKVQFVFNTYYDGFFADISRSVDELTRHVERCVRETDQTGTLLELQEQISALPQPLMAAGRRLIKSGHLNVDATPNALFCTLQG